jgi:RimJ/RimL family protein N-acetyltransferase
MSGQWNDISQSEAWILQQITQPDSLQFTIEISSDTTEEPKIIGSIGTLVLPESEEHQKIVREIGFMLHPHVWGKGYASEALQGLIKAIFEKNKDWTHLIARADEGNRASNRVIEKSGFKKVEQMEYENMTLGKRTLVKYELAKFEPTVGGGQPCEIMKG